MKANNLILLPYPKEIEVFESSSLLKKHIKISIPAENNRELFSIARRLKEVLYEEASVKVDILAGKSGDINFTYEENHDTEAYLIDINSKTIEIKYSCCSGAFYAVSTLKQLITQCKREIPCMLIKDKPDYKRRGIMLDISRDKIPTLESIYKIVDFMSDVKLNELQLYIEGFSFAYASFPQVWSDGTPITPEEMMMLDKYCSDRYIDLVPNQNSFGHMAAWLNRKEYEHLADCPEGCLTPWGTLTRNTTLNPLDKGSIELVEKQYDDLLPNFTSTYFNVGLDEPFELGFGKSKDIVEKLGEGRVYIDYLLKIYDLVKKRNKRMMFWGDIIIKSPELIPELPKDIIALEWGYEGNHPFKENCEKYKQAGLDFYVCPGTSSWCTILGRTENMRKNLLNAAEYGLKNGAIGFLNTDWGDMGHIQYIPVSYPGFVYGAALNWSVNENKDADIEGYLNKFIFKDEKNIMGKLIMDLGNYYLQETVKVGNATKIFWILNSKLQDVDNVKDLNLEDYYKVEQYLVSLYNRLDESQMCCEDAELILEELRNGISYCLHGVNRIKFMMKENKDEEEILHRLKEDIDIIINNHSLLWLKRNKLSGLEQSLDYMRKLKAQYE
jgi:hypothetical protein